MLIGAPPQLAGHPIHLRKSLHRRDERPSFFPRHRWPAPRRWRRRVLEHAS